MPSQTPKQSPRAPLNPPTLRWLTVSGDAWWQRIRRPVFFSVRLTMLAIWWSGYSLGRAGQTAWRLIVALCCLIKKWDYWINWIFRIATILTVGYLGFDRLYETDATISVFASDPADPFSFPFTITNNSHLFTITDVQWTCVVEHLKAGGVTMDNVSQLTGSVNPILPGQLVNFDCAMFGRHSHIIHMPITPKVENLSMVIGFTYKVRLFGIIPLQKHPRPTRFTWFADATNPQWIRGEFAR